MSDEDDSGLQWWQQVGQWQAADPEYLAWLAEQEKERRDEME